MLIGYVLKDGLYYLHASGGLVARPWARVWTNRAAAIAYRRACHSTARIVKIIRQRKGGAA